MAFHKSSREQAHLRLALNGPSGSGKTFTALAIGTHLVQPVAVIDSERGSASKYAGDFTFDVQELDGDFSPRRYIDAINEAAEAKYPVLIIDGISHAWAGKGGALELHDAAVARQRTENTYTAWRDVTPLQNEFIDSMLQYPGHLIVTMRSRTEYVLEDRGGKKVPKKVGMAPVQRAGVEYEFDVTADLDLKHRFIVSKTRCRALDDYVGERVGKDVADILSGWLSDGVPARGGSEAPEVPATDSPPAQPTEHPAVQAALDAGFVKEPMPDDSRISIKHACMSRAEELFDAAAKNEMPKPAADSVKGLAVAIFGALGELDGKVPLQVMQRVAQADIDPKGLVEVPK